MRRRDFCKYLCAVAAAVPLTGCFKGGRSAEKGAGASLPDDGIHLMSGGTYDRWLKNEAERVCYNRVVIERTPAPVRQYKKTKKLVPEEYMPVTANSRSRWNASSAIPRKMRKMNGVNRITVHHEGNPQPNYDSTPTKVESTLRKIQKTHFKVMRAGDIAYHFIIDRQGMIWQGRDLAYQGAHSKGNNSHNIGIMCLGNFEIQQPTAMQVATLERMCKALLAGYGIPPSRLYGHKEMRSTACPGKNLFKHVVRIRESIRSA